MVIAVRTERGTDGLEVVKEAGSEGERIRLHREAEMLRRAAHPGVVDIVSEAPGVLRLRHRGTPLARLLPLPPDNAVAVVRALAETVAAVHRQGVAHGRIDAEHVVVGERGRPMLCGFGQASDALFESRADDVASLGRLLDHVLDSAGDALWSPAFRGLRQAGRRKKALAAFRTAAAAAQRPEPGQRLTARQFAIALQDALPGLTLPAAPADPQRPRAFSDIPADFDPTADLGWSDEDISFLSFAEESDEEWITGQNPVLDLEEHREPQEPAEPAEPADPDVRPSPARQDEWVGVVRTAMGDPTDTNGDEGPSDDPPRRELPPITIRPPSASVSTAQPARSSNRRALAAVAAVVLVLGGVVGAAVARSVRPLGGEEIASSTDDTATTTTVTPGGDEGDTGASSPPTYPAACSVPDVAGPDVDGDTCPEPVQLEERVATVGTVRVELGQPGDLVVVADSDCDGVATPAVLRPDTGEVFVFSDWSLDEPVEVDATTVVPRADAIQTGTGECPAVVVTGDGIRQVVAGQER